MGANDLISGDLRVIGTAKASINTATTTNFDFGTPNDLDTAAGGASGYRHGDRIVAVFRATTTGTADTVSFSVQDAPDDAGSIGTPGTAVTSGTLTGGTGDQTAVVGVRLQPDRPWLRFRVTSDGTTDTFVASCVVLSVPTNI